MKARFLRHPRPSHTSSATLFSFIHVARLTHVPEIPCEAGESHAAPECYVSAIVSSRSSIIVEIARSRCRSFLAAGARYRPVARFYRACARAPASDGERETMFLELQNRAENWLGVGRIRDKCFQASIVGSRSFEANASSPQCPLLDHRNLSYAPDQIDLNQLSRFCKVMLSGSNY